MPICETCGGSGRLSCGACWNGQSTSLCPDCRGGGVRESDGAPCERCKSVGRFTPPSCTVCGNSLPCPECGDMSGEWRPGYRF
ncbi:MAG: molecular chaperone DnaJ [Desulfovibrio sp.]|uniref:molecular chaperone DnaJ n=1 Tax=Desulfovibrio sp. TaxID=885 RepID=UPI001A671146|nr:molecular chaperone DnaJ [Desulfovibrio sp.]MBD5416830.1 molecular chaperone DnaJ [Desulfovibrio sp.]